LSKGKVLSRNKQNLARQFSNLHCLMNTLLVCLLARPSAVCSSKLIVVMLNIKVRAFLLIHELVEPAVTKVLNRELHYLELVL